eukprot:Skav235656  [mRNA]  locus=scaffold358:775186:776787:- [translate_table: standard]
MPGSGRRQSSSDVWFDLILDLLQICQGFIGIAPLHHDLSNPGGQTILRAHYLRASFHVWFGPHNAILLLE